MTRNAISVCVVTNSRAFVNKAILSADQLEFSLSRPKQNFRHIPFDLRLEKAFNNVEVLAIHRRKSRPRAVAYALPNEDGEEKSGCSDSGADSRSLVLNGSDASFEDIDVEEVSSFSYSRQNLFENGNRPAFEAELLNKLKAIRLHLLASKQWNSSQIKLCHRSYSASATNLIHYMALKCLDIEEVKEEPSYTDLFNWEIDNSCVLASLEAGIKLLENLTLESTNIKEKITRRLEKQRLMRNKVSSITRLLLGPLEEDKTSHVMVTVGSEAIENETLVIDLIKMGASIIRINCAHGDPIVWSEIIRRVRTSSRMTEKPCRVLMDLAGPKLRTGKLKPGPNVTKISPKKDASGTVIIPARIWLSHRGAGPPPTHVSPDATLLIDGPDFLREIELGDTVRFNDARGRKRALKISRKFHVFSGVGLVAECTMTSYIESGTRLHINRKKGKSPLGLVVDVPAAEPCLRLRVGDILVISRGSSCDRIDSPEASDGAHRITCPSGLLFDSVKPGEPISFDNGKIQGKIEGTSMSEIVVKITHAKPGGTKLGPQKSINIPESNIRFEGLTSKDLMDLEFVASQADMVGVSFVRDVNDIVVLFRELEKRKLHNLGIVLKIETRSGFENLALMLLEAMKSPNPLGVMIARGDLAVECGWERLADIQEEILSICSAAHLPVVWATQVLESFVKSGVPTRAEITDVSIGRRASCVMLNKGRHVVEAVLFLDAVLRKKSTKTKAEATVGSLSGHLC